MYYANKLIKETAEASGRVGMLFDDNTTLTIPKWEYEACITEEESDLTEVRNKRANIVVGDLLKVLLEKEAKIEDVPFITMKLTDSVKQNFQLAIDKLFNKGKYQLTFLDVDCVLRPKE